ncbi:endogenous retrovirus group K member 8 Pol protein-like protein [Willisornis vidua]|uniref:Endogenous retrovirus group K member 8 Pol protein-like protein n=1 Tax=Willisornis vidua TaxID=1566151 RepID=A0ABQ9DM33_9PASS|nr:endogenous retrovirus group K member 8 Pol protein-like protein [Willisornis vidua]
METKYVAAQKLLLNMLTKRDVAVVDKYVHVTIDTFSNTLWATAQAGEKGSHVIWHLANSFAVMGVPQLTKTDNAPSYIGGKVKQFLATWGVKHVMGIPHLSTRQAIVERANQTLKAYLQKQKDKEMLDPQTRLSKVLFTLNFLSLSRDAEQTPVQLHYSFHKINPMPQVSVHFKDPATGQWLGPRPLLFTGRGYSCVSMDAGPLWVPCNWIHPASASSSPGKSAIVSSNKDQSVTSS